MGRSVFRFRDPKFGCSQFLFSNYLNLFLVRQVV